MNPLRCWQVDAFTNKPFEGNPAAVCWLDQAEMSAEWMQSIASEMNLAETAFVRREGEQLGLRWFTPKLEVDLCGHATLAAAHVLWEQGIMSKSDAIHFRTRSGELICRNTAGLIDLDFPATPADEASPPDGLLESLRLTPVFVGRSKFDYLIVVDSEAVVRSIEPDFQRLAQIPARGVMVTSLADSPSVDFVSRFFAPAAGIDEDPVTGSAHCCLGPYWSACLGRSELQAQQLSHRGGCLRVTVQGDRVLLGGEAVTVLEGNLLV